jgi:hypothetical protein
MGPVEVSAADVILLKNGDRVSGDIITMEDTVLKVDTDYADVIYIDWEDVAGLTSDKPLWVSFHEHVVPHGIGVREGDRLILFRLDPDGSTPIKDFYSSLRKAASPATHNDRTILLQTWVFIKFLM